jgi:hypothetical protein
MPTFWERATQQDSGATDPLPLDFFSVCLQLYARDLVPASIFERGELALTIPQLQELTDLLATMPQDPADRAQWPNGVLAVLAGARVYLEQLDSVAKVKAALGVV